MSSVCLIGVKPWMGGMFIVDRISLTSHHILKLVHNPLPSLFQAVGTDEGEAGFCSGCHATVAHIFWWSCRCYGKESTGEELHVDLYGAADIVKNMFYHKVYLL